MRSTTLVVGAFALMFLLLASTSIQATASVGGGQAKSAPAGQPTLPFIQSKVYSEDTARFAFVSNFEDMQLDGWMDVQGTTPTVVTSPNYSGEPVLKSTSGSTAQIDYANSSFITGQTALSFQVAMRAGSSNSGYIGLASSDTAFVAIVGVSNGYVYAGKSMSTLKKVETVPTGTAYPKGWVYIIADVFQNNGAWTMEVFVDETAQISLTVNVPQAGTYNGALIETTKGTVYYTNIIFSTYQIANLVQGYNNMQGYGQRVASAGIVQLLPLYKNYTAVMTLNNWTIPQSGILSFQINALNKTASETPGGTCLGFFQLGMDVDQGGQIDPWYVPGIDCEAQSFVGDFSTPKNSVIVLSVLFLSKDKEIEFKEVDTTISKTLTAVIPYPADTGFVGAYTQMEFQPCCNDYPITDYGLHGSLTDMQITTVHGVTLPLNATYMIPFNLDTPTTWDLTYYQNSAAGYVENNVGG